MFRIVTVEREYGSGGGEIACELSKRLGWKVWDRALTEEIAKAANVECSTVERCEERADGTFQRLVKVFWRGSHERSIPLPGAEPFDPDRFVAVGEQVMEKIAEAGNCVIVGRGAPYFLRRRADAFNVFLYSPHAEKLKRLLKAGKSKKEAEELLGTIDRDRITFVKRYFNADWPTRCLYHMMINTAAGNENVISTILSTMRALERAPVSV
ncbi:MAG TPA: cytidylate kinase-like family protein [Terriglobales bacterium]|jgi:cytidylate kinase|nr:cytidylate kinase-like family protein [Terriglobales bacterium]